MKEFSQKRPGNKAIPTVPTRSSKEAEMVENRAVSKGTNETENKPNNWR
jgi:hypothetical protein